MLALGWQRTPMAHSAPRLIPSIIFNIPLLFSYCPPGRFSPLFLRTCNRIDGGSHAHDTTPGMVPVEERWIDLNIEGAKYHREHRVPIVSSLYPSLEELVRKAGEAGMEPGDQVFNVGWFDLMRKRKYPEVMNEYPLRAFFRRLSRECKFTITPHRFRHTVATHMMKSPERNLYAVKKLLGHVSITSTLEYIDESVDSLRDILETELM